MDDFENVGKVSADELDTFRNRQIVRGGLLALLEGIAGGHIQAGSMGAAPWT